MLIRTITTMGTTDADYVAAAMLGAAAGRIVLLHDVTGDERAGDVNPVKTD